MIQNNPRTAALVCEVYPCKRTYSPETDRVSSLLLTFLVFKTFLNMEPDLLVIWDLKAASFILMRFS